MVNPGGRSQRLQCRLERAFDPAIASPIDGAVKTPMPIGNQFQHSTYSRADPGERLRYAEFVAGAPPRSPAWNDAMAGYGRRFAASGVRAVVFLHGTFLGSDLFGIQRLDEVGGLKRGYSRGIAGLDALLALMREETNGLPALPGGRRAPYEDTETDKGWIDQHAGDASNFTQAYVDLFKEGLHRNLSAPLPCLRLLWSSEHHHLGRAFAALQLVHWLDELAREHRIGAGDRMLVLAHGHAGLVMALTSNLLCQGGSPPRTAFVQTVKQHAKQTHTDAGEIERLVQRIDAGDVLHGVALDTVTFGTPVRYGWDPSGLGHLLHIVNHRPMRLDGKRWLAKMELPQITMEMPIAWGGDYVQQLAVGGTDAVPSTPDAKAANKALWELLEPYEGFERWLECVRKAVRCQNDGRCVLVDYKDSAPGAAAKDHLYGHAAYTRMNAMLFNAGCITSELYPVS